jgi:hypothetical protein
MSEEFFISAIDLKSFLNFIFLDASLFNGYILSYIFFNILLFTSIKFDPDIKDDFVYLCLDYVTLNILCIVYDNLYVPSINLFYFLGDINGKFI